MGLSRFHSHLNIQFESNRTLLHTAARNGFTNICNLLIAHGANANARTIDGRTPLHLATIYNQINTCRLLLGQGANINITDTINNTPLNYAVQSNNFDICEILLNYHPDINITDHHGKTPLHYAVIVNNSDICTLLLNHNPNVNARDNNGQTPLHLAILNNHFNVCRLLLNAHADVNILDNQHLLNQVNGNAENQDDHEDPRFCNQKKFREYLRNLMKKENKTTWECSACWGEKPVNDLWCIFDCRNSEHKPFYDHCYCSDCIKDLQLEKGCPTCGSNTKLAPTDADR